MDGWTDRWMNGRTDGWVDGQMDEWTDGWMDGRTDGWMDGQMDEWMLTGDSGVMNAVLTVRWNSGMDGLILVTSRKSRV